MRPGRYVRESVPRAGMDGTWVPGFNEARTLRPGKYRTGIAHPLGRRSFNEARTLRPGKSDGQLGVHLDSELASMRPGRYVRESGAIEHCSPIGR